MLKTNGGHCFFNSIFQTKGNYCSLYPPINPTITNKEQKSSKLCVCTGWENKITFSSVMLSFAPPITWTWAWQWCIILSRNRSKTSGLRKKWGKMTAKTLVIFSLCNRHLEGSIKNLFMIFVGRDDLIKLFIILTMSYQLQKRTDFSSFTTTNYSFRHIKFYILLTRNNIFQCHISKKYIWSKEDKVSKVTPFILRKL